MSDPFVPPTVDPEALRYTAANMRKRAKELLVHYLQATARGLDITSHDCVCEMHEIIDLTADAGKMEAQADHAEALEQMLASADAVIAAAMGAKEEPNAN